jgi:hypothetical protein
MDVEATPKFFVPMVDADKQEEAYASMAEWCRSPVLPLGERIYSITFMHDGVEWTATVGKSMTGAQRMTKRVRGETVERTRHHTDRAVIMAIFPGYPYLVCHDNSGSHWVNPFMAGTPKSVRRFT